MALNPKQQRFVEEYLVDLNATQAAIRAGIELREWSLGLDYYVYLLIDPLANSVFYVGKGKGKRCLHHQKINRDWKQGNLRKISVIDDLESRGLSVLIRLIGWGLSEDAAFSLERNLIRGIGKASLTNAAKGQFTESERDVAFAKDRLRHLMPFDQWMAFKPRTERDVELYWIVANGFKSVIDRPLSAARTLELHFKAPNPTIANA